MSDGTRFEDFARISADWFWETDIEDRFTYFSVPVTRTGIVLEGKLGLRRRDGAAQEPDNFERLAALEATIERREPFRDFVFRVGNQAGQMRWCSISGEPRHDQAGDVPGLSRRRPRPHRAARGATRGRAAGGGPAGDPAGDARRRAAGRQVRWPAGRQRPDLRDPGHSQSCGATRCRFDLSIDPRSRPARRIRAGRSRDAGARTQRRAARDDRQPTGPHL